MSEKKKSVVNESQISEFLERTGFVFEMRMNELLTKLGYQCKISSTFLDLETKVERELDLIASKNVANGITIHLLIECKQSVMDKWIFLHHEKTGRFYLAVKHLPKVSTETMRTTGIFRGLHVFNRNIPLAHNYICYSHATEKKGDQTAIEDCIHKVPKALSDYASRLPVSRHFLFPVALFSGQLFSVSYSGSLVVKEEPFLQYSVSFRKQAYIRQFEDYIGNIRSPLSEIGEVYSSARAHRIREVSDRLGEPYQIDFVSESAVTQYISMVEEGVATVLLDHWQVPEPKETTSV